MLLLDPISELYPSRKELSTFIKIGLGVAIAAVFPFMVGLGIEAFYPSPDNPFDACSHLLTAEQLREGATPMENPEYKQCFDAAETIFKIYNRNLFAITSVIGFITIVAGALLFGTKMLSQTVGPVAPGLVFGGVITTLYGVMRGLQAVNTKWLFLELVVILIGLILVTMRYLKTDKET